MAPYKLFHNKGTINTFDWEIDKLPLLFYTQFYKTPDKNQNHQDSNHFASRYTPYKPGFLRRAEAKSLITLGRLHNITQSSLRCYNIGYLWPALEQPERDWDVVHT